MEGDFIPGEHINEWCKLFQYHTYLSILSARKHSKSETAYAYIAWRIFRMDYKYLEKWMYISYKEDLAGDHIANIKERININPFFVNEGIKDITDARTILYYKKGENRFFCQPSGIMTFKRGKHPDGVITDDILRDPETKLDVSQIIKINTVFFEQVMSLPKEGGCGVKNIGTPQDESDLFHELEQKGQFTCGRYTARKDYKDKNTLWPDMFSWERLDEIERQIGKKAFQKEFMCVPVRSTEGFFDRSEIDPIVNKRLENRNIHREVLLNEYTYGGLDIGKKRHPSHISIFGKNRKGHLIQLISLWLDHVDYGKQLEICKEIIYNFKVFKFLYDDTRAEFESFNEAGNLPGEMVGFNFTSKKKHEIATGFETRVLSKTIQLIKDPRQIRQILNCDNDLKSMETPEGHGDSFWSNALAIEAARPTGESIQFF